MQLCLRRTNKGKLLTFQFSSYCCLSYSGQTKIKYFIRLLHVYPLVTGPVHSYFNSTESIQSCNHFGALNLQYTLILKTLKYLYINHGDQRVFFNLKSSKMSWLALSGLFENLGYGSIYSFSAGIDFRRLYV